MDLMSGAVWGAFGAIVVANILLSGDNAVVIAMAARSLPPSQQKKAIFWGSAAAIVLRIVLTIAAVQLLQLPYLKLVGALALLWIGVQLLVDTEEEGEVKAEGTMAAAIRTILVADLVMSIDNVIAVAGAADRAPEAYRLPLLIVGLAMSIPLIIAGSTLLMKVMERFPIIITLGAGLLGYLAGQMLATDPALEAWFNANVAHAEIVFGAAGALGVVAVGRFLHHRQSRAANAV
ncbi:MAG TPA: TerC family protein [Caldimonas sp.]|jgi:YjbE family integral membrane protein|nr:TerC family protein [Caldimonas sp.]